MRAIEKRRPPLMTAQRWVLLITAFILLLITLLFIFLQRIQAPIWSEEREAKQRAAEVGGLQEVTGMHKHIWDSVSWIVSGVDADGIELYVWLPQDGDPFTSLSAEAYSIEQLRADLLRAKPGAEVKHIQPGLYNGSQSWEIFYAYKENAEHYYYDFYNFYSGELITTYKLPTRTEP